MTRQVVTIAPEASLFIAARRMREHGRPHAVEVGKVHLAPGVGRDDADAAAIDRFERDHGAGPWHLLADEYEIGEGG